jgi:hypothetical protein
VSPPQEVQMPVVFGGDYGAVCGHGTLKLIPLLTQA